jgi:DinB family.
MNVDATLRAHLSKALDWADAHVDFNSAVAGVPPALRGAKPAGAPHSAWELLEHLRLSQEDILDFCRNPEYQEGNWPADYWPASATPPDDGAAWDASVAAFRRDLDALKALASDTALDLFSTIPHGTGQTYLRELLLVIDHNSYHIGQLVALRRQLGSWPA